MPKRTDIRKILIIGSGPIVIGQACEFDYSGTQACKALKSLGYEIVLVNSNPATIMTDPETADVTYIEPLNVKRLTQIIETERPDALLPNLGGQSGLNLCAALQKQGVLEQYGVEVIGVEISAIERGEDRIAFKKTMDALGIEMARSEVAYTVEEAASIAEKLGYPVVLRPAYTMGGEGGGLVHTREELETVCARGLQASLIGQVLVEESILGWEELELEVVRDKDNNMITVCFIENVDPVGVHTGDSFCTAPMLTIDRALQEELQKQAYKIVEHIGVIGGTNVQFAHDPKSGRVIVIEINPRTSRSSALASKATGFPIALISAKLAAGLTLKEIPCGRFGTLDRYKPGGDYVVVKFARWAFEKFKGVEDRLGTQMRAVGEVMAIGATYKEALQKAIRSLEKDRNGLGFAVDFNKRTKEELLSLLETASSERHFIMYEALRKGAEVGEIAQVTHVKPWFIAQMQELVSEEENLLRKCGKRPQDAHGHGHAHSDDACDCGEDHAHDDHGHAHGDDAHEDHGHAHDDDAHGEGHEPCYATWKPGRLDDADLAQAKMDGFSDKYLSAILDIPEDEIRSRREAIGVEETWRTVHVSGTKDSVYYYSTYCDFGEEQGDSSADQAGENASRHGNGLANKEEGTESGHTGNHNENHRQKEKEKPKIMILGGGPNRIGQGIEFDYCCVHAAKELRAQGYETIMVNCNPETVSTDYDTSDKLYFEPLTLEDVLAIYRHEKPVGVIAQFGGQTPLNLASALKAKGVTILGTQPEVIDMAEDRDLFRGMMEKLHIPMPESGMATTVAEAVEIADRIGYPVMVRPSYVLGGRGMEIVYDDEDMKAYMEAAVGVTPDRPVLIDRFLQHALECEADAIADGSRAFVPAVMEHIELAGIHSGDSACLVPSRHIPGDHLRTIREYTAKIAEEMHVVGLMNIQYAIEDDVVYVLEANPRASRTVPLVSKVCNIRMVPLAIDVITAAIGGYLSPVPELKRTYAPFYGVKQAVFPFNMFQEVDPVLGPEMRSTGEVLGLAETAGEAYLKSREAAGESLPREGAVLISVNNLDKPEIPQIANAFAKCGYKLYATGKTCDLLHAAGIEAEKVSGLHKGSTDIIDLMENGSINILINTPTGKQGRHDGSRLRKAAIRLGIPYLSTMAAARAAAEGLSYIRRNGTGALRALQSWNAYSPSLHS